MCMLPMMGAVHQVTARFTIQAMCADGRTGTPCPTVDDWEANGTRWPPPGDSVAQANPGGRVIAGLVPATIVLVDTGLDQPIGNGG